jgi:eukaryotic-like serine/threonine-protein kinase
MSTKGEEQEFPTGRFPTVPSDAPDRHAVPTEAALEVIKASTRRQERARIATAAYNRLIDETPAAGVLTAPPSRKDQPDVGDRLGRFHLTAELGRGFSSVVYKAHHAMLDIDVALKVLLDRNLDEKSLACVYRESHLLATLNHPGIIRILDFDRIEDWHIVILEYVDGLSLRTLSEQQGPMKPSLVIDVFEQAAEALEYAHSKGVVHNDIKPANILLMKDGTVKVADLGMAKVVSQGHEIANSSQVCGTPAYISPEMVSQGLRAADHRSDIYSLGVSMFQCLSGQLPFNHTDPYQLMVAHVQEEAPPLTDLVKCADIGLATLVACMMAKRPEDRPQTYRQLLDDLKVIQESLENDDDSTHMEIFFDHAPRPQSQPEGQGLLNRLFRRGK